MVVSSARSGRSASGRNDAKLALFWSASTTTRCRPCSAARPAIQRPWVLLPTRPRPNRRCSTPRTWTLPAKVCDACALAISSVLQIYVCVAWRLPLPSAPEAKFVRHQAGRHHRRETEASLGQVSTVHEWLRATAHQPPSNGSNRLSPNRRVDIRLDAVIGCVDELPSLLDVHDGQVVAPSVVGDAVAVRRFLGASGCPRRRTRLQVLRTASTL